MTCLHDFHQHSTCLTHQLFFRPQSDDLSTVPPSDAYTYAIYFLGIIILLLLTQILDGGCGEGFCHNSIMSEDTSQWQTPQTPACICVNIYKHSGQPYYHKYHIAIHHMFIWLYHLASLWWCMGIAICVVHIIHAHGDEGVTWWMHCMSVLTWHV